MAPKFDRSPYKTPEEILLPFFQYIKTEEKFGAGLDLCCGTGAATIHLAKICDQVTALDLSDGMLDQCRKKMDDADLSAHVTFLKGDALELTFEDRFDVVVSFGAFGHIPIEEEEVFLRGIFRALRPGGSFYFITTDKLPFFSFSNFAQRLFNGIMRIRNWLIRPPFIMYYLTFRLPLIRDKLAKVGFQVDVRNDLSFDRRFNYLIPLKHFKLVIATKPLQAL